MDLILQCAKLRAHQSCRAEETLAIQKTAARAAEEKCAGLQCDLAAVRAELALEHRKTAAQTHQLKQRQQEADALAKALMERSVEVEDVSLELERESEHLADAEQRCLDTNAVAAACRTEAKVMGKQNHAGSVETHAAGTWEETGCIIDAGCPNQGRSGRRRGSTAMC